MGTLDSAWIRLSCKKCGITEDKRYSDKGSMWSGSCWNDIPAFEDFDIESTPGGKQEPEIISAKCAACGETADKEHGYKPF